MQKGEKRIMISPTIKTASPSKENSKAYPSDLTSAIVELYLQLNAEQKVRLMGYISELKEQQTEAET